MPTESIHRASKMHGFTLIELLIIISILTLLAAILFPVFARVRENARRASCQSNLKQLALGAMQYAQDYDEKLPMASLENNDPLTTGWHCVIYPYVKNAQVYRCPSHLKNQSIESGNISGLNIANNTIGYGWNVGADTSASDGLGFYYTSAGVAATSHHPVRLTEVPLPAETFMIGDVADNTERFLYVYHNLYQNPPTVYRYLPSVHFEGANFAFVDGHVKWLSLQKIIDGERFYTRAED